MAIQLEIGNQVAEGTTAPDFTDINVSLSHTLANGSGNNRMVLLVSSAFTNQLGNLTVSSPAYNGVAPSATIINFADVGSYRTRYVTYRWNDADLPSSPGAYTAGLTFGNCGAIPTARSFCIELTGVDQVDPVPSSTTNDSFGSTPQTYTPGDGNMVFGALGWRDTTDASIAWGSGDIELDDSFTLNGVRVGLGVGYTTNGTLTATPSTDLDGSKWGAFSINESVDIGGSIPAVLMHMGEL